MAAAHGPLRHPALSINPGKAADSLLDHRPFVQNPGSLHQDAFGCEWKDVVSVVIQLLVLAELVFSVPPAEKAVETLRDLNAESLTERFLVDEVLFQQDASQTLQG